jgi:delta24-sterol reductase
MDQQHSDLVSIIQAKVREHSAAKTPYRVYHGSTNSTRVLTFKRSEMIDVSALDRVISVDTVNRVAVVEPNVAMDKLVAATLKYGLIPPVVTEFPGITVGGGIQGAAAETSSFKWGCFSQTTNWIELILGDGQKLKVSAQDHPDLYYGTAGSCGSLGLVTAAEIKLIPAKRYVTITHHPVKSFDEAVKLSQQFTTLDYDFIECIMLTKNHGSVIVGTLSDTVTGSIHRFIRPFDTWYFLYVEKIAALEKVVTNTVPLKDYLFRYNRGAFGCGKLAFDHFGLPFNGLTRLLLDPLMRTRKLYQALQESAAAQIYVCQDVMLPTASVVGFMDYIDEEFALYPTGFCPIKPEPRSPLQPNGIATEMLYNVAVYGMRLVPYEKFIEANRKIEEKTHQLGGKKWFYAHSYYSQAEFWKIYDQQWYNQLREKYHATTLPDIYARIAVKQRFKVMRMRRVALKILFGRSKLRIED